LMITNIGYNIMVDSFQAYMSYFRKDKDWWQENEPQYLDSLLNS
jgi:hypothetical protein